MARQITDDNGETPKSMFHAVDYSPRVRRRETSSFKSVLMLLTEQEALQLSLAGNTESRGVVVAVAKRHYVTICKVDSLFETQNETRFTEEKKKTTNVAQKYEHM